ncbi:hypothetical protein [Bradyrhizobium sp. Tv2a-2]|uniref:hypothetical protein n=1 Tax=Bradyrhizobium sp. Tv2a-2 TaxID=113395 RepID=UPI00056087C2|nr:hypothetical protein [Bradyrhizobium sp. Tv2a-2]
MSSTNSPGSGRKYATDKPAGSGWFSFVIGTAFILLAVLILAVPWDVGKINANQVLMAWMIFSGLVMGFWGLVRILTATRPTDLRVGQNTLNFCVAIIGATFAILAIVVEKH